MTGACVLFRARNRRGLGHLMRAGNLATALRVHAPSLDIHVHASRRPPEDLWPRHIPLTSDDDLPWRETLARLAPRVVVFDTTIELEQINPHLAIRPRRVLVMRQRTPEQHRALMADPALAVVDRFIVPHERSDFGSALPAGIEERTTFVGPITRAATAAATVRARHGIAPDAFLLTVTVGGGGFADRADRFFDLASAIVPAVHQARPHTMAVVVLGPNYRNQQIAARLATLPATTVVPVAPDLVDLIAASDLVVAEGGYNTVNEIRVAQVPAVFVPSARTLDDQAARVGRVAATGAAMVLDPATRDVVAAAQVASLASSDMALAEMRHAAQANPLVPGNQQAAAILAEEALCAVS